MNRARRKVAWLCALAAVRASGWVPQPAGVWSDGSVAVALEFANTAPNSIVAWSAAANEAIAAWNAQLQRVQLTTVPPTGRAWYDNGRNELFFGSQVYGEAFPSGVVAITLTTTDRDDRVEADIVFNSAVPWSVYQGPAQRNVVDFRRVAVHELGHLLGLGHPDEAGQNVSAIMNSEAGEIETPTADDQAGIHALYDRGSTAPPVILRGPTATPAEVVAGRRVKIAVVAGGRGPFRYVWKRDGVVLPNATDAVLRLEPALLADAGNYTVDVSNAVASVSSARGALLQVTPATPPRIVDVLGRWEVALTAGTDYTLEAQGLVSGDYPVTFEWKRNSALVGTTAFPNFTLKDVQFSDAGDYTVTATNAGGSVTTRAVHVTVLPGAPPRILVDPAQAAFAIGSTATISVGANVAGSGLLTYQWTKDGVEIPNGGSSSLVIPSFQATDAGNYTVTVSNAFGRVTSAPIAVSVVGRIAKPPLVTSQPAAVTEYAGADVQFTVQVEGSDLSFRWLKDGLPLPLSPSLPGLPPSPAGATYYLNRIKETDAGVYSVEVTNTAGMAMSRGARLVVLPDQKPLITTQPSAQTVAVGGVIQLSVAARSPFTSQAQSPLPYAFTYQWFKDGAPFLGAGGSTSSLFFSAAPSDAGRYFARVTSPSGLVTDSDTVAVAVTSGPPPIITQQPGNQLIDSSDAEVLRLSAVALTVMARRAAPGADASLQLVSPAGAPIGGVTPGTYVIRATKDGVTATSQPFTIGFLPATTPVILSHPRGRTVDFGESFELFVVATAYAPVTYQWSKDGTALAGATQPTLPFRNFAGTQAGSYRVAVTSTVGTVTSEAAVVETRPADAPIISGQPLSQTVMAGAFINLSVTATGGTLRYQWLKDGRPIAGATRESLFVESIVAASGAYSVLVNNGTSSTTSRTAQVRVLAAQRPPEIVFQPESQAALLGGDVTFVVGADGGPLPDRYQWRKDGVDIPGANDAELRLRGVQSGDAGRYTVVAYNANGSATSAPAVLTIDATGRLVNIATRASVGTGSNVLIAGFVVAGTQPRSVLVRAVGDQLSEFGVSGVLRNPYLKLFDAKQRLVATSDDWYDGSDDDGDRLARIAAIEAASKQVGAFPLRSDVRDGALIATLQPGSYTAQVSGVVNTTGVALVEIYELGKPSATRLANLSSRGVVGTGAQILIPGVVISGQAPRRLLVRAIGPGLVPLGVGDALTDPVLRVFDAERKLVAENDNWSERTDSALVASTSAASGAFPLASGSRDAALVIDLAPGAYTVQVSGVGGATGVALVEIYEVNP